MGYQLNGIFIPRPKTLSREYVKLKSNYTTIVGKECLDYAYTKEKYLLGWETLTKAEADAILNIVELNQAVSFSVDTENLTINSVNVFPFIASKEYSIIGDDYYVSLTLELIEESV